MKFAGYTKADMATSDPVPEATYHCRLAKLEYYDPNDPVWKAAHPNSEAKGPGLNADFVIQDETVPGATPGEPEVQVFGRHIFSSLTMGKGKDWQLRMLVEAAGKDDDWELDTDELIDMEFLVVTTLSKPTVKYPNVKNDVKKILPLL